MTELLGRRAFLQGAAMIGAGLLAAPAGVRNAFADDGVRWASLQPGFTVLVTEYIRNKKLDEKNGFRLAPPEVYTSVPTYYGDFVAGNYDVCIGSWDTFAVRYLADVPIKLLCTITTGQMINFMSAKETGIDKIEDLAGKVVAAPQSTGTYRLSVAVLREMAGFDIEKQATIQNVTNPAASVSLLRAGSAQAALTWEPNVTNGMAADPNLQTIFNVGETYEKKTGRPLPYFGVGIRDELIKKDSGIAQKVDAVFRDCIAGILGDVDEAVQIVGESTGFDPEVLKKAISSGRLSFVYGSMSDPKARDTVMDAADFFAKNKLLSGVPDKDFLVQS